MNIVCLFIEDFLVALARRDRPELWACPVVVGGSPEEHAEVKACSREAASAGVVAGTTLRRALALCPNAVFLAMEERHALAEAERLNAVLRAHSPAVEVIAPGHIHADVQGLARMTGQGESDYLHGLHEAASLTCGLPVRIGAASTVFAAHAAALQPDAARDPVRLVQDEEAAAFIGALPIEILPLPPQVHQRLRLFGLERLGQLAALSFSAVQAQFGKAGARAWELAQGKDESSVVPQREEVIIAEELDLPAPTALYEPLIAGTRALLQRALGRGDVRGHSLRRMDWRVALESGEVVYRKFVFREPTNDLTRMLFVVRSKIERLQLTAAAVSLQVTLSGLCSEYGHQGNLWQTGPRRQKELMEAVEQLNAREGEAQVFRIVEVQPWSRIPERQLALIAFGP